MYEKNLLIPEEEIKRRIFTLKKELETNKIDYAIIQQNADMFYFTGIVQQGVVLISAHGEDIFFVKKNFNLASEVSNFPLIKPLNSLKEIKNFISSNSIVGFEGDVISFNLFKLWEKILNNSKLKDISFLIKKVRAVKSQLEIEYIKKASLQYTAITEKLPEIISMEKTENEIFNEIINIVMENGHQGFSRMRSFNQEMFFGHVFGTENGLNNSYLDAPTNGVGIYPSFPQGSSKNKLKEGNLLSVDIVTCFNGYHCDQARPFKIGNHTNQEFLDNFQKCLEILYKTLEIIKPGVLWEAPFYKAAEIAKKLNVSDKFMLNFSNIKFVGHGIGVEVDEFPFLAPNFKYEFKENMVFAFEPKIFLERKGVVGIENTYRVTDKNVEKLTQVEDKIF